MVNADSDNKIQSSLISSSNAQSIKSLKRTSKRKVQFCICSFQIKVGLTVSSLCVRSMLKDLSSQETVAES